MKRFLFQQTIEYLTILLNKYLLEYDFVQQI